MKRGWLLLYLNIFLFQGCSLYTTANHKKFSLLQIEDQQTTLFKDGYYYCVPDSVKYYARDKYKTAVYSFFLYKDGFFAQTIHGQTGIVGLENYFRSLSPSEISGPDGAFNWGKYAVKSDSIYIECFSHKESNFVDIKKSYGIIESDSTIILTGNTNFRSDGLPDDINQKFPARYFFKKFTEKPDSVNWIMKRRWYTKHH